MEDCSKIQKITERLVKAGLKGAELRAIWGGNALRVIEKAQALAAASQSLSPMGGGE